MNNTIGIYIIGLLFFVVNLVASLWKAKVENDSYADSTDFQIAKRIRTIGNAVVAVIAVALILFSGIYTKSDQQIGFVNVLGTNTVIEGSGIKFKTPFISKAYLFDGTTQSMTIGYVEKAEGSDEYEVNSSENLMITSDFNFIETDFYIEYQITDPIEYYYGTDNPTTILRDCALTAIKNNVGLTKVDDIMTTGKALLESQITEALQEEMTKHNLGLTLVKVSLQDVDVPTAEVKQAFDNVETAKQKAIERENNAKQYKNEQIPAAEAAVAEIIAQADASRTERINQANAEVSEFNAIWEMYKNSDVVKEKIYYDTLVEVLPNMDIIISEDSKVIYISNGDVAIEAGLSN